MKPEWTVVALLAFLIEIKIKERQLLAYKKGKQQNWIWTKNGKFKKVVKYKIKQFSSHYYRN